MKSLLTMFGLALGLSASGCLVGVDHHHSGYGDAVVSVEWSVDGSTDPAACDANDVRYAGIRMHSSDGVEQREVSCDAFGTDFDLPPGRYWVDIVLLDRSHDEITRSVQTDSRSVVDGDYVVIDFPLDSFL